MYKKGDRVIHTNDHPDCDLTLWKSYEVIKHTNSEFGEFIYVVDDRGVKFGYKAERFIIDCKVTRAMYGVDDV